MAREDFVNMRDALDGDERIADKLVVTTSDDPLAKPRPWLKDSSGVELESWPSGSPYDIGPVLIPMEQIPNLIAFLWTAVRKAESEETT